MILLASLLLVSSALTLTWLLGTLILLAALLQK